VAVTESEGVVRATKVVISPNVVDELGVNDRKAQSSA
jgi:hypothetical protein